jgi:eukaryotic-like serine/threonine-protein kinase
MVGDKIGPFTVERELGAGAMGAVYLAKHDPSGQRVAIKVMVPGLGVNDTAMQRFKKESDILKQLRHPNIVRLIATGKFKGTPFYAMEYVQGESLDRVMSRRGRISWEEVVEIGKQLCGALKHAHDAGIVHRDLKPSNVMVLPDGTVKLTDFGIAKDLDATALTGAHCTVGTAAYMSPEQCRGEKGISHKSDLYSLGVMLFELLTGDKPFSAESPMDMFMKHVNETPERVSRVVLDVPVWLDTLVSQLMEKRPEQRPYDAAMVAEALERVREKVATQTSAGADTVKGRAVDRRRLDEEDLEAARALRGKKKKKRKAAPFYQATWFKGAVLSAAILAIGFVFYQVFLKAPSAESLHRQANVLAIQEDYDELLGKDGPLRHYLELYGDRNDDKTQEMKALLTSAGTTRAERDLLNRYRKGITLNVSAAEEVGRKAVGEEDAGQFARAAESWAALQKQPDSQNLDERTFLPEVASRRLSYLAQAEKKDAELLLVVGEEREHKPADDHEKKALEAMRAEAKDPSAGKALWEKLKASLEEGRDDRGQRLWYLIAAKHLNQPAAPPDKKDGEAKDK